LLLVLVILGPFARTVFTAGNPVWREYSYLGGMDAIALGCLTAILAAKATPSRPAILAMLVSGLTLMMFCLGFAAQVNRLGLEKAGLAMTVLAIGTCLVIAATAQTRWKAPWLLLPLLACGRRSYEIYLTHMFVIFACFSLFVRLGKPLAGVPILFFAVILLAGLLGELVARVYSEPANQWLRLRFSRA
jgi:peptidoglycan/LPS O-acetylase OafA/YrhL